jgi:hypothetical protein
VSVFADGTFVSNTRMERVLSGESFNWCVHCARDVVCAAAVVVVGVRLGICCLGFCCVGVDVDATSVISTSMSSQLRGRRLGREGGVPRPRQEAVHRGLVVEERRHSAPLPDDSDEHEAASCACRRRRHRTCVVC